MIGVVPHPGATFPYSEFKGLKISPNLVLSAIVFFCYFLWFNNLSCTYYMRNCIFVLLSAMDIAVILSIFISSLLLGITCYSIYIAFGPFSKELRDPFEEHEE